MPPKRGTKVRGRGGAQASSRPTIASGPPNFFAPPSGQGTNLSWQTPGPPVPQAPRGSTPGSRGPTRGGRVGGGRGTPRGSLGTRTTPQTPIVQASTNLNAFAAGQKQPHLATPARPSSPYITLRLYNTKNTASEPFLTLKLGQRGSAVTGEHSSQYLAKALTFPSPLSSQSQESPLPTPSLVSASTSTPNFGLDLGPQTPLDCTSSNQAAAADHPSNIDTDLSSLPRIHLPKAKLNPQQGFVHPGETQGRFSKQQLSAAKGITGPQHPIHSSTMAPIKDSTGVQAGINDVIQNLYDIQSQTHGYVPETADLLVDKMTDLVQSLNQLQHMTSTTASPNNPIHSVRIAPEIVDYVDDGRNPDIFTRDFVENVQRGNAVINGKQKAFRDFSEVFAQVLKERMPQLTRHVDKIMENAGFDTEDTKEANNADGASGPQQNGASSGQRQQDSAFPSSTTG